MIGVSSDDSGDRNSVGVSISLLRPCHLSSLVRTLEEHEADVALVGVERAVVVPEDDASPDGARVLGVVHLGMCVMCMGVRET